MYLAIKSMCKYIHCLIYPIIVNDYSVKDYNEEAFIGKTVEDTMASLAMIPID